MEKDQYSLHNLENIVRAKTDKDYLGELLLHNEELIWFSIRNYVGDPVKLAQNNSMEKDDIHQIGRMGFIKAIKNFDCSRGVLFTTYAPAVIAGEVKGYLRDKGRLIKLPRSAYELNSKILAYTERIHYNKYIPIEDIAEEIGESHDSVERALTVGYFPLSWESNYDTFNENALAKINKADENVDVERNVVEEIYFDQLLDAVRAKLSERDKNIFNAKLEGKTHGQIAEQEDIAKITVTRTMNKIRKIIEDVSEK